VSPRSTSVRAQLAIRLICGSTCQVCLSHANVRDSN